MGIRCGIVGLPNVGKSTLFNALTNAQANAENYPFTTIEPNVAIARVPDNRLIPLATIYDPAEIIPTRVEFVDIAGLVTGASVGEGLGNKFLSYIREVDAIAHVVRCFEDPEVSHVSGRLNPRQDVRTINHELAMADLGTVERSLDRNQSKERTKDKTAVTTVRALKRLRTELAAGTAVRNLALTAEEQLAARNLSLLTAKPTMYVANVGDTGSANSPYADALRVLAALENAETVPIAARIEAEIAELDDKEKEIFLADIDEKTPGLNRIIQVAHRLLGLGTFFTGDQKQVRAWTFRNGATALECAGLIHTDFQRGFICAEVVTCGDLIELGSNDAAKGEGRLRIEGRNYKVTEGDVIRFRFNT